MADGLKEYRMDVRMYGTVYVKATSPEAARAVIESVAGKDCGFELPDEWDLGDDARLSPAFTFHGPDQGDTPELVDHA